MMMKKIITINMINGHLADDIQDRILEVEGSVVETFLIFTRIHLFFLTTVTQDLTDVVDLIQKVEVGVTREATVEAHQEDLEVVQSVTSLGRNHVQSLIKSTDKIRAASHEQSW